VLVVVEMGESLVDDCNLRSRELFCRSGCLVMVVDALRNGLKTGDDVFVALFVVVILAVADTLLGNSACLCIGVNASATVKK
jgi:hypothetical protein